MDEAEGRDADELALAQAEEPADRRICPADGAVGLHDEEEVLGEGEERIVGVPRGGHWRTAVPFGPARAPRHTPRAALLRRSYTAHTAGLTAAPILPPTVTPPKEAG